MEARTESPPAAGADAPVVDLRSVVDDQGLNAYRAGVLLLITLAMFADGFDSAAISFAAPMILADWGLQRDVMGSVFSVGVVGTLLGGGVAALLGDWIGRRNTIILSALFSALSTLGTVLAHDVTSLMIWRFLGGAGVGALSPLCLVMANEYAPARIRASVIAFLFLGFSGGGHGVAGWVAAAYGPAYGWQALFYVGGVLTLVTTLLLVVALPESLKHLYVKGAASEKIARIASRLNPALGLTSGTSFVWTDEERATKRPPFRLLFAGVRAWITPVLWICYFCAQIVGYALTLWLPTLLKDRGVSGDLIAYSSAAYAVLGLVGAMVSARLVDHFGVICHAALPLVGVPILLLAAGLEGDPTVIAAAAAATGFSAAGTLIGMSVIAGFFYPTAVRSTGVGLAIFVSRFGSILGPIVVGVLLSAGAEVADIFRACAVPALIAGVGLIVLGLLDRPRFRQERLRVAAG